LRNQLLQAGRRAASAAAEREAKLQKVLDEKEHYELALREVQRRERDSAEKSLELRQELSDLSANLSQKEDDVMTIQFDMATLQLRMRDQISLVMENADAFQHASEELADKDDLLEKAQTRQEELLGQMNEVSTELQEKVMCLTKELEGSRSAYGALEEQTKSVVSRLEADRDALSSELGRCRAEAKVELARLKEDLRQREAANAEWRASMELELAKAQSSEEQHCKAMVGHECALSEARRCCRVFEERLCAGARRLHTAESENFDLTAALERSRLQERQAFHTSEEHLAAVQLYRYRDNQASRLGSILVSPRRNYPSFQGAAPLSPSKTSPGKMDDRLERNVLPAATPRSEKLRRQKSDPAGLEAARATVMGGNGDENGSQNHVGSAATTRDSYKEEDPMFESSDDGLPRSVPSVLISVELDFGAGKSATLCIAPWQTPRDFDHVVGEFLKEHRLRPIFKAAVVKYLKEVESQAETYPVSTRVSLHDLYSRYG